jgi:hypothetical protein
VLLGVIVWDFFGDPVEGFGLRKSLCCLVGLSFTLHNVVDLGALDDALNILYESHRISEKALVDSLGDTHAFPLG